jgi:RHS repeat-associated protein
MTYDAFGRRVRKEVIPAGGAGKPRTVEFVWDGDALAADLDSDREARARCFVHEPGTLAPLLQEERGEVFAVVNDHLGTPKELIDEAGLVAWSAAHSAWGRVIETRADALSELARGRRVESPFRLLGQVADEETRLCWTRFRCFDPEVGRWCSPDPLGIAGGGNLFAFDGSPTCEVDALGLSTGSPHAHGKAVILPHPSERAARRAAMREAGIGKHGPRVVAQVPEREGSQAPHGERGMRTEIRDPTNPNAPTVHHDPWGHHYPDKKEVIPPHWGVDYKDDRPTTHHVYPSTHDPRTNR